MQTYESPQEIKPEYEPEKFVPEEDLVVWKALSRPFRKRTREFYSTIGVIVLLVSIILFFAKEFLLIGVVFSLTFIGYALGSVPPGEITYRLTNKGFYAGDIFFAFANSQRFWFEQKWKHEIVMIQQKSGFPSVVMGVLAHNKDEVMKVLEGRMPLEKPEPTPIDRWAKWLTDKVPLESD